MIIHFIKLKLNNFGSYMQAEIDLQDKGFCIVSGQNKYKKDGAASNGSGKSTIFEAIIWCLTGETSRGGTKGLKNLNYPDEGMWVELELTVDGKNYKIRRGET